MPYKIALYPGDGIGPEVVAEAVKVIDACNVDVQYTTFNWNTTLYSKTGKCVPENYLELLSSFDAILLGALGNTHNAPDHIAVEPLLTIRKAFDQYVNIRPAMLFPGVESPLKNKKPYDIDMIVIRENTEGEYTSLGGRHYIGTPDEVAMQINYFSRKGTERIIRYAFETARNRKRKHVTSITKSNALKYSMVFWDTVFNEVAKNYPDVNATSMLVDAAAMNMVRCPEHFDVVVASNLFGDILTDLAAIVVGGMGFAASGNINPTRKYPSMFEPVHGSAPDIAGKGIANPVAAILSGSLMLEFLGEHEAAQKIKTAVIDHLSESKIKTPDRGGKATTAEVGNDIARRIQ